MRWLRSLGFLRSLLVLAAVVIMLVAPLAYGGVHLHDWRLLPTVVAPAVMMVLVFVILLDMLMSRVFMADAGEQERTRLSTAIRIEAVALLSLIAAWSPFLVRIFAY
jgi:L-lactate permease